MANSHFTTEPPRRMWLTTADVAKVLAVSTGMVRRLARCGDLASEATESGQRLFRRGDVRQALLVRGELRGRSREALLALVRVRMLKVGFEPRQQLLWPRLRLVRSPGAHERSVPHAEPKRARSFERSPESDRRSYVDRKAATR